MAGDVPPPVTAAEFAALMARLGPFEKSPSLALAVSGGADSMALATLASGWANDQGGRVTALIVDHNLRDGSATDAATTATRLAARNIPTVVLTRHGAAPSGDLQAFARAARYDLLEGWCRDHGVLHLLTAHHLDDQAETLLLRLARGSGVSGLAAMAAIAHLGACRLLRPLLTVPASRLRSTLVAAAHPWIEDPSNGNEAFARVRVRKAAPVLQRLGLDPGRLGATAHHLGRARIALEGQTARLLAQCVALDPAGYGMLNPAGLTQSSAEIGLRALAALVTCIGGQEVTPRFDRLEALLNLIRSGGLAAGRTLSGCRIIPRKDRLLVMRELAAIAPPALVSATPHQWDGRFLVRDPRPADAEEILIGALGSADLPFLRRRIDQATRRIPTLVWPTLPSLRRRGTIIAVPHLAWVAPEAAVEIGTLGNWVRFSPIRALTECGFTVV